MAQSALEGDFDTAALLQIKLSPMIESLFREVNPIPVKEALKLMGYDCGHCRMPLTRASENTRNLLISNIKTWFQIDVS